MLKYRELSLCERKNMNLPHKLLSSLIILFLFSSVADAARTNSRIRCREIDRISPTTPSNIAISQQSETQVTLSWTASSDNLGIAGYYIFANGTKIATVNGTSSVISNINPAEIYEYTVQAYDEQNNVSSLSEAVTVQTGDPETLPDTTPPLAPGNLTATLISGTQIDLAWDAAFDDTNVAGYKIYQNSVYVTTVTTITYSATGLSTGNTDYTFGIIAVDDAGNESSPSSVTYLSPDTTAPTAPNNLSTTNTTTSITLTWDAASDTYGVTGYKVYLDDVLQTTTTNLSYEFTGLTINTGYKVGVEAIDAAANVSDRSFKNVATGCSKVTMNLASAISDTGFAWKLSGDYGAAVPDDQNQTNSPLRLFEDDLELGPPHSLHAAIRSTGLGRFSHKTDGVDEAVRWASSDNTNPTTNGRTYSYCVDADPSQPNPDPDPVVSGAAYPGAMGGGAGSDGGAGGSVIFVTNTNDSGTGSLRACVQETGARTCVFRTGGTITLTSSLSVTNPYITIAGQTAPGGGILIKGVGQNLVKLSGSNILLQYVRIRNAYSSSCSNSSTSECGQDLMVFGHDIMVDHVSTSWNQDEGIGSWGWSGSDPYNITIANNLIAEGLSSHSTGAITGGANANSQTNIDYYRNLFMNNSHRNPLLKNKSSRIVNNLWYNNRRYAIQIMGGMKVDIIGNKLKQGPLNDQYAPNPWDWHEVQLISSPGVDSPNTATAPTIPSIFMSDNQGWSQANPTGDQWVMTAPSSCENCAETSSGPAPTSYKRTPWEKMTDTAFPITAIGSSQLEATILSTVGASQKLACGGGFVANRDSVDTRLISQYNTNDGITSLAVTENSSGIGGFPTIAAGTPCTDTDSDGMPDEYETSKGFNINNAADRNTVAANGYTNLQNYLAGL